MHHKRFFCEISAFLALISLGLTAFAKPSEDIWSWKLDKIYYSINFQKNETIFSSENMKMVIKNLKCSQEKISEFKKTLQKKIESYDEKAPLPKDYPAIEMQVPKVGTFDVTRGSELGLFLIDIKFEVLRLKSKVDLACK